MWKKQAGQPALGTVHRPLLGSSATAAVIFRAIDAYKPTLLIDEGDTIFSPTGSEELRGVLDAGHTRTTAYVLRCVGDDHEPRQFSTWCPKVVALIGRLPGTLQDRAVLIPMRRLAPSERKRYHRLRLATVERVMAPLNSAARRWAQDHIDELRSADPALPDALDDRAQDNWRPLIAIADAAGGPWPERARTAALILSGADVRSEDEHVAIQLLADLRDLFQQKAEHRLTTAVILEHLKSLEERAWGDWKHGRPITAQGIAKLLRGFGIRPRTFRIGLDTFKGYALGDLQEAFAVYLPPLYPEHPEQLNIDEHLDAKFDPEHDPDVTDAKPTLSARQDWDVTDKKAENDPWTDEPGLDVPF